MRWLSLLVLVLLAAACGPKKLPQAPLEAYGWTVVSSLAQGRIDHTASRLQDGRILVAGGEYSTGGGWRVTDSVEVFDPEKRTWQTTGSLASARSGHTATALVDGRILVVGGQGGAVKTPLASVEMFSAYSGRWSQVAPMHEARSGHTATLLGDGRVLVVGGIGPNGLAGNEVFDPRTGRWTPVAPLAVQRRGHVAVALGDERLLVAGGRGDEGVLASVEIYEPRTNRWVQAPDMNEARDAHDAVRLDDGSVLVAGGYRLDGYTEIEVAGAEVYDPIRNEWRPVEPLHSARRGHTLTHLEDGRIVAIGGAFLRHAVGTPEVFDPERRTWRELAPLPERLYGAATTPLTGTGRVLVVGGWNQFDQQSPVALLFEPVVR